MKKFSLVYILIFLSCNAIGQVVKKDSLYISTIEIPNIYKAGQKLSDCIKIDSIESVSIKNHKGLHSLTAKKLKSFKEALKNFVNDGTSTPKTKPGHSYFTITFKNDIFATYIYYNEPDLILDGSYTFNSKTKINFENY